MDLHDALRSRRTIQRFHPDPVPDEVLDRALAAATMAPNHKTTWPFRFVVAGPQARARLFAVAYRLKANKRGPSPELEQAIRGDWLVPAHLVAVVQQVADDPGRAEEDYAACACAVQNLLLSVHADGFGAKWNTGGPTRDAEAFAALGLEPGRDKVVAVVAIGVPAIVPQTPQRPPLAALVRRVP